MDTLVQSGPQLDLYLAARAAFSNIVFPAMGNHECTGATASNCSQGTTDGITHNYTSFVNKMLAPIQQSQPYYAIHLNGTNNAWTAKLVFVAANAWTTAQSTWLDTELKLLPREEGWWEAGRTLYWLGRVADPLPHAR